MSRTGKSIGCAHRPMTMLVQAQYPHVLVEKGERRRVGSFMDHVTTNNFTINNQNFTIMATKRFSLPGLYANTYAKQERIKAGSGEKMRKPGTKGTPTAKQFKESAKTAKNK